jgi:hypothetical protein
MATRQQPTSSKPSSGTWPVAIGALVAAGGLIWAVVSHFVPKVEPARSPGVAAPLTVTQSAVANGGTAVNATGSAQVQVGGDAASAAVTSATTAAPVTSASQSAQATSGGIAVSATDTSRVKVKQTASK